MNVCFLHQSKYNHQSKYLDHLLLIPMLLEESLSCSPKLDKTFLMDRGTHLHWEGTYLHLWRLGSNRFQSSVFIILLSAVFWSSKFDYTI